MRRLILPLALALSAACAHPAPRRLAVSDDGRSAIVGGRPWHAPQGVTLAEREDGLHVISRVPGSVFDVVVTFDRQGNPVVPADAPFQLRDEVIVVRARPLATAERLVETGQLYPHDDHFHLTHRWQNPDWQALYRAREEDAALPGATRQAAAYALATLLDRRIPGDTEEGSAEGLRRITATVGRARRAVEGQLPSKQIMAMVVHDFEILDDGATLEIEGRLFRAAPGVRFAYCGDHFHVEDAAGAWAHVIPLGDYEAGRFEMPTSMFYEVSGAMVSPRAGEAPWKPLLAAGEIVLTGDRWYVSEKYARPAFGALEGLARDPAASQQVRDAARRSVVEFLKLPLEIASDAAFEARLATIDAAMDARWRELEAKVRPPRRR